jgi:hypothetical protein
MRVSRFDNRDVQRAIPFVQTGRNRNPASAASDDQNLMMCHVC